MLKNKMDDSEIYCKLGEILYDDRFAFDRFRSAAYNEVNEILNHIKKSDIVFLGDSVLNFTDPKESVQTSVPRYFSSKCKGKIYNFSAGSFSFHLHSVLFKRFSDEFSQALKGKVILFEINPRWFSDEWYIRPSYTFKHVEGFFSENKYDIVKLIFSDTLSRKTENFYNLPLTSDITSFEQFSSLETIKDVFNYFKSNPNKYNHQFDFYYGYSLPRLKSRISEMDFVLSFIRSLGTSTHTLFYFVPLNYRNISTVLNERIRTNVEFLGKHLEEYGFDYLDLTGEISNYDYFLDKEHLKSEGRKILANSLAKKISPKMYHTLNSNVDHYCGGYLRQIEPVLFRKYASKYAELIS